jgi:hypothetical protein
MHTVGYISSQPLPWRNVRDGMDPFADAWHKGGAGQRRISRDELPLAEPWHKGLDQKYAHDITAYINSHPHDGPHTEQNGPLCGPMAEGGG